MRRNFSSFFVVYYQSVTILFAKKPQFSLANLRKVRTFASGKSYTTSSL